MALLAHFGCRKVHNKGKSNGIKKAKQQFQKEAETCLTVSTCFCLCWLRY